MTAHVHAPQRSFLAEIRDNLDASPHGRPRRPLGDFSPWEQRTPRPGLIQLHNVQQADHLQPANLLEAKYLGTSALLRQAAGRERCDSVPGSSPFPGPLSSRHISPLDLVPERMKDPQPPPRWAAFTYAANGRFARVKIRDVRPRGPGGQRGQISHFSNKSQHALFELVNSLDQRKAPADHFAFITCTYARAFPTAAASKRDLDNLLKRFEREFGRRWLIWKLEPQKRGAPHFHVLLHMASRYDVDQLCTWFANAWHQLVGGGDRHHLKWHLGQLGNRPCVERVKDWQGVISYAGKYLGKVSVGDEEWQHPGRYWGQRRAEMAPRTIVSEFIPDQAAAILRRSCVRYYQRQLSGWAYLPGGKTQWGQNIPGRRVHKKQLPSIGLVVNGIRWQRRRWRRSRGTWSGFIPAATFKRLVEHAIEQCLNRA